MACLFHFLCAARRTDRLLIEQVCDQPATVAVNVTLPAFAAAAPLLLATVERYLLPAGRPAQTCHTPLLRSVGRWDRRVYVHQTDMLWEQCRQMVFFVSFWATYFHQVHSIV